jgi:hypothetical protein
MTVNIANTIFAEYKHAAQLISAALVNNGYEVPLNQLIDVLINAELSRVTPEDIARHFMTHLRSQQSQGEAGGGHEEFLHTGENGENPNSRAEAGQ